MLIWFSEEFQKRFLNYRVDRALHEECIAPKGSSANYPCDWSASTKGEYVCHRYDKAAFNAILNQELGFGIMKRLFKKWCLSKLHQY